MPTTTSRLLTLLSLLQTGRDWPGALLAQRLDISHRTVRRDIDRLREMGYRIQATMGPDGGYRLDAGSELPPLLFDDEQVVALAVALQAATASGAGIEEAALRALTTVRQVLPSRLRHRLDALQLMTVPRPGDGPPVSVDPGVLVALSTAVLARTVIRFDHGGHDAVPPRRAEPHQLVTMDGRWYLLAWDLDQDDWRVFRADRLAPRASTGARFTPREVPGGDARAFVSARFKGSDHTDVWPCIGSVVLHVDASSVTPFAGDGTVEQLGAGRCRYTAGSWSWMALAASLGRFDTDMDEAHPPELAKAFMHLADRSTRAAG